MTPNAHDAFDANGIATAVARLVAEKYVFPQEAAQISGLLTERAASGAYSAITDVSALADALTEDAQSVNGDRHLRVIYTDEPVVDLADEEAELEMWQARAEADAGGIAKAEILEGNVGLLEFAPIIYPAMFVTDRLEAAMATIAGASALIIDVRACIGGSPDTVNLACSYLFDDEPVHLNTMLDRSGDKPEESWTLIEVPGRRFGSERPVVVLTSHTSFSGAEELAYDLQQLGRARIVGEQTGGGANPREGFRVHDHLEATIPIARPVNPVSGTNWELVGVTPDVAVASADALAAAIALLTA
jgi:C-terminal processing protease CtpA/Prc